MDIYEYADSIDWAADYYDQHTGYIYAITEVAGAKKFFDIELPIPVYDITTGDLIGHVRRED